MINLKICKLDAHLLLMHFKIQIELIWKYTLSTDELDLALIKCSHVSLLRIGFLCAAQRRVCTFLDHSVRFTLSYLTYHCTAFEDHSFGHISQVHVFLTNTVHSIFTVSFL